jgi:glycyl-tRNA synthetase beta chain
MNDLLFEICTEELPAGYIQPALNSMAHNLKNALDHARITHGDIRTMGTPRRLSLYVSEMADAQESQTREETGPPQKVAYDDHGNPKVPAMKFVEKWGKSVDDIFIKKMPKGEYLCLTITDDGKSTAMVLQDILPKVIDNTPFPKTMRWSDYNKSFARPVISLLCLLGETSISLKWGHLSSGTKSWGHRFVHPESLEISSPKDYEMQLAQANVVVDIDRRKLMIQDQINTLASELGGQIKTDSDLLDIVTNLVEYPVACAGRFEEYFLEVPAAVLICAMREHQKYFALTQDNGKLMPCFIAVNNTPVKDMALVSKGHERVLRARLSDARFFYQGDLKEKLDDRVEKLKGVLFQSQLGTVYDKTIRVQELSSFLAQKLDDDLILKHVSRAAWLCKSDLVTQVVNEFPTLQGIMGNIYAQESNEDEAIATAIQEHYQPTHSGGDLPKTMVGTLLAVADKMDTICGCFGVGLKPTGTADPYALRRHCIGVIRMFNERQLTFSLQDIVEKAVSILSEKLTLPSSDVVDTVIDFFHTRMVYILTESGISKDVATAVLSAEMTDIPDIWSRAKALENLKKQPDFKPLAAAFKRVGNILKKIDTQALTEIDPQRFEHDAEKELYETINRMESEIYTLIKAGHFDDALKTIASIRPSVDRFFDDVLVMASDAVLKNNRLKLLVNISKWFERIADFTKMSG